MSMRHRERKEFLWYHRKWDLLFVQRGACFESQTEEVMVYFWEAAVRDWSVLEKIGNIHG